MRAYVNKSSDKEKSIVLYYVNYSLKHNFLSFIDLSYYDSVSRQIDSPDNLCYDWGGSRSDGLRSSSWCGDHSPNSAHIPSKRAQTKSYRIYT